jgi:hypothetical protein
MNELYLWIAIGSIFALMIICISVLNWKVNKWIKINNNRAETLFGDVIPNLKRLQDRLNLMVIKKPKSGIPPLFGCSSDIKYTSDFYQINYQSFAEYENIFINDAFIKLLEYLKLKINVNNKEKQITLERIKDEPIKVKKN